MKNTIFVLFAGVMISACATDGSFKTTDLTGITSCPNTTGYTFTAVGFGEGKFLVIPLSEIRRGTEWRFYLLPEDLNDGASATYGTNQIVIDGKTDPPPPANDTWLFEDSDFNSGTVGRTGWWIFGKKTRYLTICVPQNLNVNDVYHYFIEIDGVGLIDPRARVDR